VADGRALWIEVEEDAPAADTNDANSSQQFRNFRVRSHSAGLSHHPRAPAHHAAACVRVSPRPSVLASPNMCGRTHSAAG